MSQLFEEFEKVSPAAWKQKIQVDLKGADYNETLLWQTEEGITIKPFYTEEDRTYQDIKLPKQGFLICQSVFVDDENIANSLANDALTRGATSIKFEANARFDFKTIFRNIDVKKSTFYFKLNFLDAEFVQEIAAFLNSKNSYFQIDVIGNLAKTGNWYESRQNDFQQLSSIIQTVDNSVCVDASLTQNAGANRAQQLAYALSKTNEYIEQFGIEIIDKIHFQFAVGSNYFLEIGKLRAFRILLDSLLGEYGIQNFNAHILCTPSKRNKTLYDYNVNMLRTTSECMSAILGGANTISNISYDHIYNKSNEFGERISRNQLLILQQESYLAESQKIANGSYYIESITHQLAEKALLIFKQLEKAGGYLKQLKEGKLQLKIKESADKELEKFLKKDLVLLGTNKLQNGKDKMKGNMDLYPFVKVNPIKTIIPPIIERRIAEDFEQQRLKEE